MKKTYIIKFEVYKAWWMLEYKIRIKDCEGIVLFISKQTFPSRLDAYKLITKIKDNACYSPINFINDN